MGIPPQNPPPYYQSRAQWKAQRAQWKMQSKMQRAAYRASYRNYSRGSLVGPLLLVAIGVIALLMTMNRINAAYFWQWYGHWWPLILIGAGVILALESMAFSGYSRVRLGGGVVLLGIILAIVGVAAAHHSINWSAIGDQLQLNNSNLDLAQMFGDEHDATEQIDHALPANATVVIQNPRGDLTITTAAADAAGGQMQLTLNKKVYTDSDSKATERLRAMEPLITSVGNIVTVNMPSNDRHIADMSITLPADVGVQLRADHGAITVTGRNAPVTVNAQNGDVQLAGIVGAVHATMHQGDFSASNVRGDLAVTGRMNDVTLSQIAGSASMDGDFFGDVHLENLHGPIHFHSSRTDIQLVQLAGSMSLDDGDLTMDNVTGPVAISTRDMEIQLHRVTGAIQVHNSNGGVDVKTLAPIGAMNIANRNGSVQVTVPADAKFSFQATAVNGEVHTDFNLGTANGNERSAVSGPVGGGGPLIRITADSGDITLHKGEADSDQ
jgi:DUF4097 and DUF4098 domain-containing protein YvlB